MPGTNPVIPALLSNGLAVLGAGEDGGDRAPDKLWALGGVDRGPDTGLPVVVDDGASLLVVRGQSLSERFGVVVGSLDEGLASLVVGHVLLGRVD